MIFQRSEIDAAAECIKKGELVAFPTETVYGLGASVFLPEAIKKIFQVKKRPQDNPLIVHISSLSQLNVIVKEVPDQFYLLAEHFFPGPLTVLLPKLETVPPIVSANLPLIGVRMPDHPLALQLIEAVGSPLVAPSANLSGRPSSTTAQHVLNDFGSAISGVIDGGACKYGIESTVLLLDPNPLILRPGGVSQAEIEEVLQSPVSIAEGHIEKPLSPGMKYKHYSPNASIVVFNALTDAQHYMQEKPHIKRLCIDSPRAFDLYALFRQADIDAKEEIVIVCDDNVRSDRALMNRIHRSCS